MKLTRNFLHYRSMDSTDFVQIIQLYGLRVVGANITLIVGYLIAGWLKCWIKKVTTKSEKIDNTVSALFAQIAFVAILLITITATLNPFSVATTSIVAALGAAGLVDHQTAPDPEDQGSLR